MQALGHGNVTTAVAGSLEDDTPSFLQHQVVGSECLGSQVA